MIELSKAELLLLHLVDLEADLNVMVERGWTYAQLGSMLGGLLAAELILHADGGRIRLSTKGRSMLDSGSRSQYLARGAGAWIVPREDRRQARLPLSEVYIPTAKEARTLGGRRR